MTGPTPSNGVNGSSVLPPTTTDTNPTSTPAPKAHYTRLSNETTLSRWAYTNLTLKIRKSPSSRSRSVGKLHFNTEDGPPEIYLALQLFTTAKGDEWVQIRIPGRPNGRKGWVPREGLGEFHVTNLQLIVNRRTLRGVYGDGSAILDVTTFSGSVVITKR